MQRHRQDAVGARRRQQVGDQPRGNRDARRVLLVRAGIGEVRDHRRDARRRRAPRRIQHQQQLHQVLLHGRHQRLDDEHVRLPAIDFELHAQTVVAEGGDGGRAEAHLQPFAQGGRQLRCALPLKTTILFIGGSRESPRLLPEHLGLEPPDTGAVLPGILRQAGLAARLAEKLLAVPAPLGGHLRQQQPAAPPFLDHESVPADLDLPGAGDRFERPEERQLDHQIRDLRQGDGREPRVGAARGNRAPRDDIRKTLILLDVTDAAAQLPGPAVQRHERAAAAAGEGGRPGLATRRPADMGDDCVASDAEEELAVGVGGHPGYRQITTKDAEDTKVRHLPPGWSLGVLGVLSGHASYA